MECGFGLGGAEAGSVLIVMGGLTSFLSSSLICEVGRVFNINAFACAFLQSACRTRDEVDEMFEFERDPLHPLMWYFMLRVADRCSGPISQHVFSMRHSVKRGRHCILRCRKSSVS